MSATAGQRGLITRFIWDGNVPLHEWTYDLKDRPALYVDALGEVKSDEKEPIPRPSSVAERERELGFLNLIVLCLLLR